MNIPERSPSASGLGRKRQDPLGKRYFGIQKPCRPPLQFQQRLSDICTCFFVFPSFIDLLLLPEIHRFEDGCVKVKNISSCYHPSRRQKVCLSFFLPRPPGPLILPPAFAKARLICRAVISSSDTRGSSWVWPWTILTGTARGRSASNDSRPPARCCTRARSTAFSSSRTLPGQSRSR
jgi:hypothetical protein